MPFRRKAPGKRQVRNNMSCIKCGEPGRVRGIERGTWRNVAICDECWGLYFEDQEGKVVVIEE